MTRLLFVRHGRTPHNAQMVITSGYPGVSLDEVGRGQVTTLAGQLGPVRDSLAAVYSSPLRRAVETAAILNDELATGLQPQTHDGLSEGSVGDLEGQSSAEHFARFDATFDHWYLNGDLDHRIGGTGERGSAAVDRISGVVDDLVARHPGQTVLVVGHGTILQLALTALCANLPLASGYRNWIENAGVVDTVHDGRHLHCLSWSGRPPVLAPGLVDAPDTKGDHSATAA